MQVMTYVIEVEEYALAEALVRSQCQIDEGLGIEPWAAAKVLTRHAVLVWWDGQHQQWRVQYPKDTQTTTRIVNASFIHLREVRTYLADEVGVDITDGWAMVTLYP